MSIADHQIHRIQETVIIAQTLFRRDIDFVKEILARIQFEEDLSRFQASQRRLSEAMLSSKKSQQAATDLRESVDDTQFNSATGYHLRQFTTTHLFRSARPQLERYYRSKLARCRVGIGLPGTTCSLTVV